MQEVFNFISSHYELFISGITLIISVVMFIVRKKPIYVSDILKTIILNSLPLCIRYAETHFDYKGEDKKHLALTALFTYLSKEGFGSYSDLLEKYQDFASKAIEDILNTPQKKGE